MSSPAEPLFDAATGAQAPTWSGFSWPCLLFGVFWFAYKRMYVWALGALVAAVLTGGVAWFAFPFFANGMHRAWLRKEGYLPPGHSAGLQAQCPECRELVRADARKCKHCGSVIVPV